MKRIYINFIGEENWKGEQNSSTEVPVDENTGGGTASPLKSIIDNSIQKATPGQIQLPKYDNQTAENILRYAAPNLTNDDYYPEKTVNSIIGSASNKTLGTFPIFSSAALAPAGLWDKRRRAVGDYMLQLEQAKTKDPNLNYTYEPKTGASPWMNVFNENAIEDLHSIEQEGRQQGISMKDAGMLGHPYNAAVNKTINSVSSGLKTVTDIDKNVTDIEAKGLNLDNAIGKRAAGAIELYKHLSSLPENSPVEFGGVQYQGKKGLVRSQGFQDAMHQLNADLQVDNDLLSLADNRAKQIEKKAIEEAKISGSTESYLEILRKKLESKYPVGKDEQGNLVMSQGTFLDDIAMQVAKSRPSLFKETGKEDSPYTLKDLKDILRSNLGYTQSDDIYIANKGAGAGSSTNTVNAAPQYVKGTLEKLNRGEVVQGKTGKSSIIPGEYYTTYITNGQMKIVPNGNVVENAKAIAEAGGADNEYGGVDASTAIVQMNTGKDAGITYNEFQGARPSKANVRYSPKPEDSQQQRFNQSLKVISGDNGLPLAGGDDIFISGMQSMATSKDDSKFYLKVRDGNSKVFVNGVVIPKDKLAPTVENPNAGLWDTYGLGDNKIKLFVSKGQEGVVLDGAYYKYNPASGDDVASYTIYDKNTNSPYKFPSKDKFGTPYEIKLPEYYVKKILLAPEKLVEDANKAYKGGTDEETPNATQLTSVGDTKTKTGGKGQTITIENKSTKTKEERAIEFFKKKGYSQQDAVKFTNAYKNSKKAAEMEQWNKF